MTTWQSTNLLITSVLYEAAATYPGGGGNLETLPPAKQSKTDDGNFASRRKPFAVQHYGDLY